MTLNVEIYEMEYSVSPGGVDCWEMTIGNKCYSGFKTAGHALDHLLIMHPSDTFDLSVTSLNAYHKEMENALLSYFLSKRELYGNSR